MRRRSVFQRVGVVFVVGYLAVLAFHGPTTTPELFPVFNWSLFSEIPDPSATDYGIRLTSVDGVPLDEPVYYEDATGIVARPGAPEAYQVIQRYGQATEAGQLLRIDNTREQVETVWLGDLSSAEYELVRREFDVLEAKSCDCFESETVLANETIPR